MLTDSLRDIATNHGWPVCDEAADKIEQLERELLGHSDYELGKNDGWEACETCHDIVDGVSPHRRAIGAEVLQAQEPVVTDAMALSFHQALTDGSIGQGEIDEIKIGLRAAIYTAQQPPAPCPDCAGRANGSMVLVPSAQLKKLQAVSAAFDVWIEKSEWVQEDKQQMFCGMLGMHRADALRIAIDKLQAKVTAFALDRSIRQMTEKRNTELIAKVAEQSAEIERLTGDVSVFQTDYIKECELNIKHEATVAQQAERIAELEEQLETERMRLAACGVVALANTPDSAGKSRKMLPKYRSGSLDSVEHVVDSEMRLRSKVERQAALLDQCEKGLAAVESLIDESKGVTGLHLNGDLALWGELRSGGNNQGWLVEFDEALAAIAAHRSQS